MVTAHSDQFDRDLESAPVEIIAHRGASHAAPENTIAAARLAWVERADALEVDVHLTRDGRLAVIHDSDTLRTAGVRRIVAESTWAELAGLDVGSWKDPVYRGEKIPDLPAILWEVPAGKRLFIELKGPPNTVPEVQRCVLSAVDGPAPVLQISQVVLMAFDFETARAAKAALPACEVCWLAESGAAAPRSSLQEIADAARAAGLDGIDVDAGWTMDARLVKQIRGDAFKLYAWTVDDAPLARKLAAAGLDGIATNRPARLRAELGWA